MLYNYFLIEKLFSLDKRNTYHNATKLTNRIFLKLFDSPNTSFRF